jgi:hypothetical protein
MVPPAPALNLPSTPLRSLTVRLGPTEMPMRRPVAPFEPARRSAPVNSEVVDRACQAGDGRFRRAGAAVGVPVPG